MLRLTLPMGRVVCMGATDDPCGSPVKTDKAFVSLAQNKHDPCLILGRVSEVLGCRRGSMCTMPVMLPLRQSEGVHEKRGLPCGMPLFGSGVGARRE